MADVEKVARTREIVEDINALLQGDIEGEAQVRGILVEARDALAALAAAEEGEQPVEVYNPPYVVDGLVIEDGVVVNPGRRVYPVASPPSEASRDERAAIRKEAFEEAADMAEAWASERGDGFMSLATAIRARGET